MDQRCTGTSVGQRETEMHLFIGHLTAAVPACHPLSFSYRVCGHRGSWLSSMLPDAIIPPPATRQILDLPQRGFSAQPNPFGIMESTFLRRRISEAPRPRCLENTRLSWWSSFYVCSLTLNRVAHPGRVCVSGFASLPSNHLPPPLRRHLLIHHCA